MTTETSSTQTGVILTDTASAKVATLLAQEGREDLALRIAVQPGGCSGLRYQLFFDERSLDYYDYTGAEWYLAPRAGVVRSLVGPYVDFNGLNDYIVTATTPVFVDDAFVGIAGADLSVDKIERRLVSARRASSRNHLRGELVIVNASDRIVASTSALHIAGSLFAAKDAARQEIPGVSWSILEVD